MSQDVTYFGYNNKIWIPEVRDGIISPKMAKPRLEGDKLVDLDVIIFWGNTWC